MIKEFSYYLETAAVKKKTPNKIMAESLLKKADIRFARIKKDVIDAAGASIILEDAYEAIREAAQSLMEIAGFKPYSHDALIAFLKSRQLLNLPELGELDRYRILRNESVYEAKEFSVETCKEAVIFAENILPKIRKLFFEKIGEAHGV